MEQQQLKFENRKINRWKRLLDMISNGAPVLTVNDRLSRYIRGKFDGEMRDKRLVVWNSPTIMPLMSWLNNMRENSCPDKPLISDARLNALWETVAFYDPVFKERETLMPQGAVRMALDAYKLMCEYRISLPENDFYSTEETVVLKRWIRIYRNKLKKLGFIDRADLGETVVRMIGDNKTELDKKIVLAGFDEITPSAERIVMAMKSAGSEVIFWPYQPMNFNGSAEPESKIRIRGYGDETEEVIQAARWVRNSYKEGLKVGVIAAELHRYRDIIKREFDAELSPVSILPWESSCDIYNMSLGTALYDEPLIRFAVQALSLEYGKIDINKIGAILLSPYLVGSNDEYFQLARLDAELKKKNIVKISLPEIRNLLAGKDYNAPSFFKILDVWIKNLEKQGLKLPSEWSQEFHDLLRQLTGFSGGDPAEYQTWNAWRDLLSEFAGLDDILGKTDRVEAVSRLVRLATDRIFQTQQEESQIEVMGLLEASGMEFDRIWILGAHEDAVPGEPSPNPFIPIDIQKKNNMPHSSYERELDFSKTIISRVINSAPNIEISWPCKVEDKEVKLSPLICSYGIETTGTILFADSSRYKDAVFGSSLIEEIPAEENLPVTETEKGYIRGGTSILKNQSDCPFRAFSIHRLSTESIIEPEPGITAIERGDLVHKAMERFWGEVKNADMLVEFIQSGRIDKVIDRSVDSAVEARDLAKLKDGRFVELEKERLKSLLMEWVKVESKRACFETERRETGVAVCVAGLEMNCRIDRLDRLKSGGKIIIDYKTGRADTGTWLTERPKEPQLMLYSMTGSYDGVAFAVLKRGECRYLGITRDENMLPGVSPFGKDRFSKRFKEVKSWKELMGFWSKTVTSLAGSFMKGDSKVDPRDYDSEKSACKYCDHMSFCRVFESERVNLLK